MRKHWAHAPTASGSYGRLLAGWQTKCGWISKFLKFSTGLTIWIFTSFNIVIMLLSMHFNQFFLAKAYFKVCIEAKKSDAIFSMSIPTVKYYRT